MEGQESFVHRAAALMPALRVPLLLNNLVAMSLSFVACGDFILHNGYINDRAALALAIMFNLSIAQNLLVSVRYFQARRIKLLDRSDAEILPTVVAAVDIVLAVAFLILYIVETNYAASNPWYYANNTVKLYVAFGALIAWYGIAPSSLDRSLTTLVYFTSSSPLLSSTFGSKPTGRTVSSE